jgi:hypothetical protein
LLLTQVLLDAKLNFLNNERKQMNDKSPVIVTTKHRGVFFGYGVPSDAETIRIEQVRMVVSWSADVRSVVGLAANGPSQGCCIGPAAPAITLRDVTSVIECSKEATDKFEAFQWK